MADGSFSRYLIMTIQQLLQIAGSFLIQIWEVVMVPKSPAAWLHLPKTKAFLFFLLFITITTEASGIKY